jgi:hypothetical protein
MDHHIRYRQIAEPEHVLDILGLAALDLAVLGGFFDEAFDLNR